MNKIELTLYKKNEGDISALKTQLEEMKATQKKQTSATVTTQQTIQAAKKETTPPLQNTSKEALFKRLMDDNVAIRQSVPA